MGGCTSQYICWGWGCTWTPLWSWPSCFLPLPIILKFSIVVSWPLLSWSAKIGDGDFICSLNLSLNVLPDSPIYSSSQSKSPTTVAVYDTVFLSHSIYVLWWHQDVLKCLSFLEVYRYCMFFMYVLYTFTYAPCIWNHNVAISGGVFLCRGLFLLLSLMLLGDLLDGLSGIFTQGKYFFKVLQFIFLIILLLSIWCVLCVLRCWSHCT